MKMNKNNGKIIKLNNVVINMAACMVNEFYDTMNNTVFDVECIQDDVKGFIELDKDIFPKNHLGLYSDFEMVLSDIKKLLCTYARISAYKVLLGEEFDIKGTIIYRLNDRGFKKIDSILLKMYDGNILTFLPFLIDCILEVFKVYKVSFKLDNKGDIVRGYTGENRIGSSETEFVVKRFYIC